MGIGEREITKSRSFTNEDNLSDFTFCDEIKQPTSNLNLFIPQIVNSKLLAILRRTTIAVFFFSLS